MNQPTLNDLPELVWDLIQHQPSLPIVIIWNSEIVFQEVYRALSHHLKGNLGCFKERPEIHTFYVKDYPAIRFFKHPEFSAGFSAKTVIDVSIYQRTLEKHPYNEERQIGVEALAARFDAKLLRIGI